MLLTQLITLSSKNGSKFMMIKKKDLITWKIDIIILSWTSSIKSTRLNTWDTIEKNQSEKLMKLPPNLDHTLLNWIILPFNMNKLEKDIDKWEDGERKISTIVIWALHKIIEFSTYYKKDLNLNLVGINIMIRHLSNFTLFLNFLKLINRYKI